jgi:3-oxoacyl-[acyl-carrier protein] reductase
MALLRSPRIHAGAFFFNIPENFRNWTRDDWIKAIDANMLTPIELIKATVDGMMARKFGRIVNITSAAVKAPIEVLGLVQRRALRPHRLCRRHRAQDRDQQRHHQRPAAGPVRHRPPARAVAKAEAEKRGVSVDQMIAERGKAIPPAASATPRNSGSPARFCAAPRPASSPARTSCSTAAPIPARCK